MLMMLNLQVMTCKGGQCCSQKRKQDRLCIYIFIFTILLGNICETKSIENIILLPRNIKMNIRESSSETNIVPRRQVRLVIRNVPVDKKEEEAYQRFTRERDRSLVKSIKKRRKREQKFPYIPPSNRRVVRIKSKTGFFLAVLPSGKVVGQVNKTNYTQMELQVITPHVKRIRSVATGKYLAINRKGKVVTKDVSDKETFFFEEHSETLYYLYCSIKYPKFASAPQWYLGLKKKHGRYSTLGKVKRASRTLPGDAATHFSIHYEN